ncbi:MAG TPA: leucyl/phenylalanyl-tRNA--protein transferase [Elusimicrobia bacterium]|nr:leucyl/phenylalanyl-tRNA--protein transferase [Elusimicrobiota bacterium]
MPAPPFPDPRTLPAAAGIVSVGVPLTVETLYGAYAQGIFPWPSPGRPVEWYCPDPRGVLDFSEFHVPKRLQRKLRGGAWRFTADLRFEEVVRSCAGVHRRRQNWKTWLTDEMAESYIRFHQAGYAHSLECWEGERLVGGLYGVYVCGVFSGESMFHREPDASKLCLVELVSRLRARGLTWIDIQMVTAVTERFGGKYIPRKEFLDRLDRLDRSQLPVELDLARDPT